MYAIMNICRESRSTVADSYLMDCGLEKALHTALDRWLDRGAAGAEEEPDEYMALEIREAMKAELSRLVNQFRVNGLRTEVSFTIDFGTTYSVANPRDTQGLGETGFHIFHYFE